jgi:hypothetical protein
MKLPLPVFRPYSPPMVLPMRNAAVRVELMARQVPSQAGNGMKQVKILKLFSCHSHVSIATVQCVSVYPALLITRHCAIDARSL